MERIKIFCWVLVFCNLLTIGIEAASTAPTISIDVTPIDVREDTALETKLPSSCTTSDTDNTTTADGTYYVEFNGGNGDRRFVVVGHSCDLYLVRPLDYESAAKTYTLQVEAKDLTTLSSTSNLLINVVDANDN
ncbi:protocadherin gamma-B7, partial [Aplysia californica]|uniref:Protocadherin gamma-B7 n=1 Tax=Aplysia californica TaxID=6500 RepID=A0ABM0ZW25_APLCA